MTMRLVFAAVAASGLLSGCVSTQQPVPQAAPAALAPLAGAVVGRGVPCAHLVEASASDVAGCESYLAVKPLSAGEAAQIADLNARFAASVPAVAYFEFGQSDLTAGAQAALDAQATWMVKYGQLLFTVYGHTDLVGAEGYNFDLAKRRAETVVAYLAARGVPSAQLEALVSYGETRPAIATERREGQNRRTVTEVTSFLSEPRLRTAEQVPCSIIDPQYLATYPVCVAEPSIYVAPPKPEVIDRQIANTTGHATETTTTDARYFNDGTTEIKETNGSAGDGAVTTGVKTEGTKGRETVTINVGGRTDVYERNADGSDARLVSSTPND